MKDNYVVFDGENLSFHVDGVKITNGIMPSNFEIKGEYKIDESSLAKLVAAIGNKAVIHRLGCFTYMRGESYIVCENSEILAKINDEIKDNKRILDENDMLRELINKHNESCTLSRIKRIDIK